MARAESCIAKQTGLCFPPPHGARPITGERRAVKRGSLLLFGGEKVLLLAGDRLEQGISAEVSIQLYYN